MDTQELTKVEIEQFRPKLLLVEHMGIIVWWLQTTQSYTGEPRKLKRIVLSITVRNLIVGWWSMASIFINPVVTVRNWVRYFIYSKKYRDFSRSPQEYLYNEKKRFIEHPAKTDKRLKYALIVLAALIAMLVFIVVLSILRN